MSQVNPRRGLLLYLALIFIPTFACALPANELPKDILGLSIGMSKADVEKHLGVIAEFERNDRRRQELWRLRNDPHYSHLAVGYDQNDQVRYVTAFGDASKARVRFSEIGDLTKAKKELTEPHLRYTWDNVAGGKIIAYGTEGEYLSSLSIAKSEAGPGAAETSGAADLE